jgi:uncharacterized protein (TIGR03067 family)
MKPSICALALVVIFTLAPAAISQETEKLDIATAEAKKFAGTWRIANMTRDGKEVPNSETDKVELIFADNQYTYVSQNAERDEGTFKLDVSKKPHVMVTTKADDADKGTAVRRLYEWKDEDTLTFLTLVPGEDAPKELKAAKGRELVVWKRDKAKPK